jgi:DNA ligase 1
MLTDLVAPSRFADLVGTSMQVAGQSSRRAKIATIAAFLRRLEPAEVAIGAAYLSGGIPQRRAGIGYALISEATATPGAATPSLTLAEVDATLELVTATAGSGSRQRRSSLLAELMAKATPPEQDYLARLLVGELRHGAQEGVMIEAVAAAADVPAALVRAAAMVGGGITAVATTAFVDGAIGLSRLAVALFQPVAPMLAQPAEDIDDAMARIGMAALEWKLDGARVQVHKDGDDVRIFSRTGNDVTVAAPEIVSIVRRAYTGTLILDGEAIALKASGAPYPFQETMSRFGRALDIEAMRAKMPLSVFFFDCLHRDGDDLLPLPASARFDALASVLPSELVIPHLVTSAAAAAQAFYDDAVGRGHEGVMVKALDAAYEPGARSASWLKVKRSHSLDLVVVAAEWGHGRRRGTLSNLHLAAPDPATGEFVMLGKTFKGMTDAMLAWQTEELLKREVGRDGATVRVRPELVVEVTFNDLQASPRYPGGVALRFARVKGYRPDKKVTDADTMDAVRTIYAGQQR